MRTPSPNFVSVGATVLPAIEMALHIAVEVICGGLHQLTIIIDVKPTFDVFVIVPPCSADDDAAISPWYQVVILPVVETHDVIVGQERWTRSWTDDTTADTSNRYNFVFQVWKKSRRVPIGRIDYLSGFDRSS